MTAQTTEVTFYHLTETSLEAALPTLVEKAQARGWRVAIQVPDDAACVAVDQMLWTHDALGFLPHGRDGDEPASDHPVFVTAGTANPNDAAMRFIVMGATPPDDLSGLQRAALMFDGNDAEAVARAREDWKMLKARGLPLAYWKQSADGKWEKAA